MDRRVLLDLDGVAEELFDRRDLQAALEDFRGRRQMRRLGRQGLVALEGDEDVLVADETLARQPVARRHIVDFGLLDFLSW